MATTQETNVFGSLETRKLRAKRLAVAVLTATVLIELPVEGCKHAAIEIKPTVHDFSAFTVQAQFHPDGDWVTLYSLAAAFTAPAGLILNASGNLTVQAAGTTGWVIVDVRGLYKLRITATGAAGTLADVYASAS